MTAPMIKRWTYGHAVRASRLHEHERTLLRSAKRLGLSVEGVLPSTFRPRPVNSAATMDYVGWQLPEIWVWDKSDPNQIGPLGILLPLGLYGKIMTHLSRS
jgi:hypothetical protein